LTPICTKSFVDWGFALDPAGGGYSAPPDPLSVFRGPASKGRGAERRGEEVKGAEERRGEGSGGSSSFALGRKKEVGAYGGVDM